MTGDHTVRRLGALTSLGADIVILYLRSRCKRSFQEPLFHQSLAERFGAESFADAGQGPGDGISKPIWHRRIRGTYNPGMVPSRQT